MLCNYNVAWVWGMAHLCSAREVVCACGFHDALLPALEPRPAHTTTSMGGHGAPLAGGGGANGFFFFVLV